MRTIDYTATWTACEEHDDPGHCTEECLTLTWQMSAPPPDDYPYDPTGCHRPTPMPEVMFVLVDGTVTGSWDHPEGECQCGQDNCPAYPEEENQ